MIVPVSHAALIAPGSVGCDAHSHSCTYWPIHSQGMGVYGHNLIPACAPSYRVTNITQMAVILPQTVYFTHFFFF